MDWFIIVFNGSEVRSPLSMKSNTCFEKTFQKWSHKIQIELNLYLKNHENKTILNIKKMDEMGEKEQGIDLMVRESLFEVDLNGLST